MHYFTKELWHKLNDPDEAVRRQAEQEWSANSSAYQEQFAQVQKRLAPSFTENYLSRQGLHDYTILDISIAQKGRAYSCQMKLTNGTEILRLAMEGLRALQVNIPSFQHCILGQLTWGYGEFALTPENKLQLSLLCDPQNELQFEFESIQLVTQ